MTEMTAAQRRRWHCFWGHLARAERMVLAQLTEEDDEDERADMLNELSFEADFDDCENCWDSIACYLAEQVAYYRAAAMAAGVPPPAAQTASLPDCFDANGGHEAAIAETCHRISGYLELADEQKGIHP